MASLQLYPIIIIIALKHDAEHGETHADAGSGRQADLCHALPLDPASLAPVLQRRRRSECRWKGYSAPVPAPTIGGAHEGKKQKGGKKDAAAGGKEHPKKEGGKGKGKDNAKDTAKGKHEGGKPEEKGAEGKKPEVAKKLVILENEPPRGADPKLAAQLQIKLDKITDEERKKVQDEWGQKFDEERFRYEKQWKKLIDAKEKEYVSSWIISWGRNDKYLSPELTDATKEKMKYLLGMLMGMNVYEMRYLSLKLKQRILKGVGINPLKLNLDWPSMTQLGSYCALTSL